MNNHAQRDPAHHSDFLSIAQLRRNDFRDLLALAKDLKGSTVGAGELEGKTVALIFEKPSLRTRVTFEVAIRQLGGWPILLGPAESRLGERESVSDLARNLSLWVDGIVARVFRHESLEELALFASKPVINALSDREHPCQALADLLTLAQVWPSFEGKQLVYVGDWNNVSRSLAYACAASGLQFRAVCPELYGPSLEEKIEWSPDPAAVEGADAVYTDVWASMGQEAELAARIAVFKPYQVNDQLLAKTGKATLFMHCLPAHRDLEVSHSVIESERSLVFLQAENRLAAEKAVLVSLMGMGHAAERSSQGREAVYELRANRWARR